jgi:hypothetical protein
VRVYGGNYEVLAAKAETVAKTIGQVAGVARPEVRLPVVEPTVEIEVVLSKAAARGVKPGDVRRAAATMLAGITAGNLIVEQKIFDVVVWADPDKRGRASGTCSSNPGQRQASPPRDVAGNRIGRTRRSSSATPFRTSTSPRRCRAARWP